MSSCCPAAGGRWFAELVGALAETGGYIVEGEPVAAAAVAVHGPSGARVDEPESAMTKPAFVAHPALLQPVALACRGAA